MKLLFVLSIISTLANAVLEWPFINRGTKFGETIVEASIGHPGKQTIQTLQIINLGQNIKIQLTLDDDCIGLTIGSNSQKYRKFNPE
jgi:hypothetical protein